MMLGALVDAGVALDAIQSGIDSLGLPPCRLVPTEVTKHGFRATKIDVVYEPEHQHRHLSDIVRMIGSSALTPRQQQLATTMFERLGQAEARVHGTSVEKVHFHEVGAVDSIADICGTAIGWDLLDVSRAFSSPVPTGTGLIDIAHGRCAVPAPATVELLRGIPLAESRIEAELTTPTGATILATLVDAFGTVPAMTIECVGCGAGSRDLDAQANLLRLLVGVTDAAGNTDQVWSVETNLDDTTGELIANCCEQLWAAGALDVAWTAIHMKKNRPGVRLTVICRPPDVERMEEILFRETGTLGIRRWKVDRTKLPRASCRVTTAWGDVDGVRATLPGGRQQFTPEYESCRGIAQQFDVSVREVYDQARRAFRPQ